MIERYNGWTNRETWAAHLWLRESGYSEDITGLGAEGVREYFDEWISRITSAPSGYVDVMQGLISIGSLWRVNWDEVASALAGGA